MELARGSSLVLGLLLAPLLSLASLPRGENPVCKDRTGLRWVLPFEDARARATREKRLLMIKPVAFGTSPDGGW